jgi:hypothetical protein
MMNLKYIENENNNIIMNNIPSFNCKRKLVSIEMIL